MPILNRVKVDDKTINDAISTIVDKLYFRINQKGSHGFCSKHEILGIVAEEYHEMLEAVKNDEHGKEFSDELIDVAVACIFGLASLLKIEELEE